MKNKLITLVISALFVSASASADLHVVTQDESNQREHQAVNEPRVTSQATSVAHFSYVTESGRAPRRLDRAGWGEDVPLGLALEQIIPENFRVELNGLDVSVLVSWNGDETWNRALASFSQDGHFVAHIDWSRREVIFAPQLSHSRQNFSVAGSPAVVEDSVEQEQQLEEATHVSLPEVEVHHEPAQLEDVVVSTPVIDPVVLTPAQPVVISAPEALQQTWELRASLTLRENVEEWAQAAGWRVVWEAVDYPIAANAVFYGEFSSPDGPLARLVSAYDNSDQPLVARLTLLDKVVYVRNRNYQRNQVVPTAPRQVEPDLFSGQE